MLKLQASIWATTLINVRVPAIENRPSLSGVWRIRPTTMSDSQSRMGLHWFLPMNPDGEFIGTLEPMERDPTADYLSQITTTVERYGFDGMLVATGMMNWLENWTTAAAMLARSQHVRMLIAVRPSQFHPAQLAQMAASLDNLFPGRIELNVVTGSARDDPWYGNFDDREQRYVRAREFFEVIEGLWYDDAPYTYKGRIFQLKDAVLAREPYDEIPIYVSGASPQARELAAEFGDTFLVWGDRQSQIASEVSTMKALAAQRGRELEIGMRIQIIVRPTEAEAWMAAERLISKLDPAVVEQQRGEVHARVHSGGRASQQALLKDNLVLEPNLWAGIGLGRWGVGTALVGSPDQVADRLLEYHALGVGMFIVSGYPKLEEAVWFGELVMPRLVAAGVWNPERRHSFIPEGQSVGSR